MRLILLLVILLFVALGIVLGALNADLVSYDLGIVHWSIPKGAALLLALLLGWLLGGLTAWLGTRWRHRATRRVRASAASPTLPHA